MKLRPLFVLLLFVASAGVLVWIYHTATHTKRKQRTDLWTETITDLDACCRRKHVKAMQYDHFAGIAQDEHAGDASRLFRAMALSERVQEGNCADAILRLNGKYTPPAKVVVFRGTTEGNLQRSIAYERQSLATLGGGDIRRALDRGNRYAARMLAWATAGDLRHIVLMEHCRQGLHDPADRNPGYLVCPVCGNLYAVGYSDAYCPICLTESGRFIRFE
ncbi:rubrerythrin family protein [Alistipes sp.]|uniref:rubrerythrin family protein n=1 Tax=Alistipes sp. TaxID=1872444 RepID=UPI003AF1CC0D